MADPDPLEQKLDALITQKLDAALKPLFEKLDKKPDEEEKNDEEQDSDTNDKTDTKYIENILRSDLKSFFEKEKLDAMSLEELQKTHQIYKKMQKKGIRNPIEQKPKTDADPNEWGCEVRT